MSQTRSLCTLLATEGVASAPCAGSICFLGNDGLLDIPAGSAVYQNPEHTGRDCSETFIFMISSACILTNCLTAAGIFPCPVFPGCPCRTGGMHCRGPSVRSPCYGLKPSGKLHFDIRIQVIYTAWICFVERQTPFFHFILPSFIFFLKQKRREKNNGKNKGKNMDADH